MNSVDVKNALETIVTLNPGLSKDKLVVLLKAASWDDPSVDQALAVFNEMTGGKPSLPHIDTEHLLEEGRGEAKKVEGTLLTQDRKQKDAPAASPIRQKIQIVPEHLPEGLPVKPFDSSPHIITFSEYKEKFAESETPEAQKAKIDALLSQKAKVPKPNLNAKLTFDIHEPLSGADLSLVVVVSFLFLVIMLLLGYMYSSGRLFN